MADLHIHPATGDDTLAVRHVFLDVGDRRSRTHTFLAYAQELEASGCDVRVIGPIGSAASRAAALGLAVDPLPLGPSELHESPVRADGMYLSLPWQRALRHLDRRLAEAGRVLLHVNGGRNAAQLVASLRDGRELEFVYHAAADSEGDPLEMPLLRAASRVIVTTRHDLQVLASLGIPRRSLRRIPPRHRVPRDLVPDEAPWNEGMGLLIRFGRDQLSAVLDAVDALRWLPEWVHLLLPTSRDLRSQTERGKRVEQRATQLGLQDHVHWCDLRDGLTLSGAAVDLRHGTPSGWFVRECILREIPVVLRQRARAEEWLGSRPRWLADGSIATLARTLNDILTNESEERAQARLRATRLKRLLRPSRFRAAVRRSAPHVSWPDDRVQAA